MMTTLFPLFVALIGAQLLFRSRWIFCTWTFLFCLLPTYVYRIGPVSLYWCDISSGAVLLYWANDSVRRRGAPLAWQWFRILMVTLMVGGVSSVIRYGTVFEPLYWLVRYALALVALPIMTAYAPDPAYRWKMLLGMRAAAILMFAFAMIQTIRSPLTPLLDAVLYQGYASAAGDRVRAAYFAYAGPLRVFGSYGSSTQFAGACVCVGVLLMTLTWTSRRPNLLTSTGRSMTLATLLVWSAALMTYSRHGLLAILVFLLVTAAVDLRKSRWVWGLSLGAIVLVSSGYFSSFIDFWLARIGKGGISTDPNLSARLQTRPEELLNRIIEEPSILYGGVGLGSEHIQASSQYGFVSNGFLLYLFYCGIAAFLAYTYCFVYAFRRSLAQNRDLVPAVVPASVLAMAIIVAADNYAFFTPNLVWMWACAVGISFTSVAVPAQKPGGTGSPGRPPLRRSLRPIR